MRSNRTWLPSDILYRCHMYIVVIGLASRAAPLNNSVAVVSLNSNGNIAAKNSSSVIVAGGILLMVAVKNWESVNELPSPISSPVESFSVFGFHWVVSFGVVFGFVGADRLFVAAVVDKLLVAAVDRLELDTLEIDRLMTVLLVGKQVGFDLGTDSEFGTGNRGFNIDFPIIGYLNAGNSQFGYVLVYHNNGRYAFPVVTVDWSMKIDVVDFGHD
ncbi:hypothetical protein G9A89_009505 [Geosiphon pyriformis]|nr:hypothetical protein G9A89_009505 [Geosiphon pyriformis]